MNETLGVTYKQDSNLWGSGEGDNERREMPGYDFPLSLFPLQP